MSIMLCSNGEEYTSYWVVPAEKQTQELINRLENLKLNSDYEEVVDIMKDYEEYKMEMLYKNNLVKSVENISKVYFVIQNY